MVGPYLGTSPGGAGLEAPGTGLSGAVEATEGVGPPRRISGRGNRLCRSLGGLHSCVPEERCDRNKNGGSDREQIRNDSTG